MADLFDDWYVHRVDIDTLVGVDFEGRETSEPHLDVPCAVDDSTSLVIGMNGTEELSSARVQFAADKLPWLTLGSTITWGGRRRLVISVAASITGDPDLDGVSVALR